MNVDLRALQGVLYNLNIMYTGSIQIGLSKQCRPNSDATELSVWSGSTLFAAHPATFIHIVR